MTSYAREREAPAGGVGEGLESANVYPVGEQPAARGGDAGDGERAELVDFRLGDRF